MLPEQPKILIKDIVMSQGFLYIAVRRVLIIIVRVSGYVFISKSSQSIN